MENVPRPCLKAGDAQGQRIKEYINCLKEEVRSPKLIGVVSRDRIIELYEF